MAGIILGLVVNEALEYASKSALRDGSSEFFSLYFAHCAVIFNPKLSLKDKLTTTALYDTALIAVYLLQNKSSALIPSALLIGAAHMLYDEHTKTL
jgi:hypothetical protein